MGSPSGAPLFPPPVPPPGKAFINGVEVPIEDRSLSLRQAAERGLIHLDDDPA